MVTKDIRFHKHLLEKYVNDKGLETEVIIDRTCDECCNIPDVKINAFSFIYLNKNWVSFYSCKEHVDEVIKNRLGKDDEYLIIELENEDWVQCIQCDNHKFTNNLACGSSSGRCKYGLSFYGFEDSYPRTCNKFNE